MAVVVGGGWEGDDCEGVAEEGGGGEDVEDVVGEGHCGFCSGGCKGWCMGWDEIR